VGAWGIGWMKVVGRGWWWVVGYSGIDIGGVGMGLRRVWLPLGR